MEASPVGQVAVLPRFLVWAYPGFLYVYRRS
jgi:hypothetical protein